MAASSTFQNEDDDDGTAALLGSENTPSLYETGVDYNSKKKQTPPNQASDPSQPLLEEDVEKPASPSKDDPSPSPSLYSWKMQTVTVLLLMVAFAFARTAVFIQLLVTPLAAKASTSGNAPSQLNTLPLAFLYYGGTFVAPVAARFMARVGRQRGFMVGCVLGMIGAGVCIFSTWLQGDHHGPFWVNFILLSIGSLFLGFGNGFANLFRFAAADVAPQRRSLAISVVLFGGDVAALIGPSLGDWTENIIWKYGGSYIIVLAMWIGSIITLIFVRVPQPPKIDLTNAPPPRTLLQLLRIPRLLLALITATIGTSVMLLLMVLIPLVMDKDFSTTKIGNVLQVHSIGMFAPGLFIGLLMDKLGTIPVDFAGLIALIAASVVMIIGQEYWMYMLGMALLGVGWNLTFISSTTLLTQTYRPSEKATTQGINDFVIFFVGSTFSLASGALWEGLGSWTNLNYMCLAISFVGVLAVLMLFAYETIQRLWRSPNYLELN